MTSSRRARAISKAQSIASGRERMKSVVPATAFVCHRQKPILPSVRPSAYYHFGPSQIPRHDMSDIADRHPMKVFLSSTLIDLAEHRAAVIKELRKNPERYSLVTMEDFTSEPSWPQDRCLNAVANCDVFVGALAWRYGAIPDGETLSFTELEYRKALETQKPIFIFLASDEFPVKYIDRGVESAKIDALRKVVEERHLVEREYFKTPDQLAKQVVTALGRVPWPPRHRKLSSRANSRCTGRVSPLGDSDAPGAQTRSAASRHHCSGEARRSLRCAQGRSYQRLRDRRVATPP